MIALVDPVARPALTIAGLFFIGLYVLFAIYALRHWRQWFGPDNYVEGDRRATRNLQVIAIFCPLVLLAGRLVWMMADMWRG